MSKLSQKGSGDSGTILIIFGACCALSILLIIFNWMGDSLQKRRNMASFHEEKKESSRHEPLGYEVVYSRGFTGFTETN